MKRNEVNKKQKIVRRFRKRCTTGAKVSQKEIDIQMTDIVLHKLYNNGDKKTASLKDDILIPNKIQFTEEGVERLWDILISTGLMSAVIGFGRSGRLSITNQGYQLMNQFGSYRNFLKQREEEAARKSAGAVMPQFIISAADVDDSDNKEEEEGREDIEKAANKEKKGDTKQNGKGGIAAEQKDS